MSFDYQDEKLDMIVFEISKEQISVHMQVENALDIESILKSVSCRKRAVANLYKGGNSQSEIARKLKISRGRVSQILREIGREQGC